jgi:hypothetical protein
MHLDCLMHFADAGRTVAAPAGATAPAAKCSDAPSMRILGDVASQPPLCLPHLSLSLSLSLSLLNFASSRPAAYPAKSGVPVGDDMLPSSPSPSGRGRNASSEPAREIWVGGAGLALPLKEQSQPLIQAPNQRCTSIGLASCFLMLLGSKSSSMWKDSPTVMTIKLHDYASYLQIFCTTGCGRFPSDASSTPPCQPPLY